MGTLLTILITLLVIAAIITILLVLLQDDQSSGLGLFGSSGQSPFRSGDNFLSRLTKIFGGSFLLLCLAVAFVISRFSVNYDALQQAQQEYQQQDQSEEESWFLQDPEQEGEKQDNTENTALDERLDESPGTPSVNDSNNSGE